MTFETMPSLIGPPLRRALDFLCGAALVATVLPAGAGTTTLNQPGGGQNRIEVTGNSATNVKVQCADGSTRRAAANVNSVNVDPKALKGRTEIVTGRNTRDVRVEGDCSGTGAPPAANVNSVNIR